ncbi:MAG TPA: hypothetical protein VHE53_03035 [Patescibacteria group bacterium]|nr:hypothetical protein [Patescibacteria group bacterium]
MAGLEYEQASQLLSLAYETSGSVDGLPEGDTNRIKAYRRAYELAVDISSVPNLVVPGLKLISAVSHKLFTEEDLISDDETEYWINVNTDANLRLADIYLKLGNSAQFISGNNNALKNMDELVKLYPEKKEETHIRRDDMAKLTAEKARRVGENEIAIMYYMKAAVWAEENDYDNPHSSVWAKRLFDHRMGAAMSAMEIGKEAPIAHSLSIAAKKGRKILALAESEDERKEWDEKLFKLNVFIGDTFLSEGNNLSAFLAYKYAINSDYANYLSEDAVHSLLVKINRARDGR